MEVIRPIGPSGHFPLDIHRGNWLRGLARCRASPLRKPPAVLATRASILACIADAVAALLAGKGRIRYTQNKPCAEPYHETPLENYVHGMPA